MTFLLWLIETHIHELEEELKLFKNHSQPKIVVSNKSFFFIAYKSANSGCPVQNNLCAYMFQYGDGSDTPGFFVSDVLQSGIRLILMTLGQTCYLILE
ncbi:hypothetical protein Bca4012_058553 [Brassica carinata]